MGVIQERKVLCESVGAVVSNPGVSSGYTTQESEDEGPSVEDATRRARVRRSRDMNWTYNLIITRHTGRRKARRVLNTRYLETLKEEEEADSLYELNKSKFQRLIEESSDGVFMYLDELENVNVAGGNEENGYVYISAYQNIPRKIRAAIRRKNFRYESVKMLEDSVTCFLYSHPPHTDYIHVPENCRQRLLLHAIARYNELTSETISKEEMKLVRIRRSHDNEEPKVPQLCDYINQLRIETVEPNDNCVHC